MAGMIPLSDVSRSRDTIPVATSAIIAVNVLVFVMEILGGEAFVMRWSAVPADIAAGHHWITLFTSMFLHAGWMHIIGNMVFLHAFGPGVEEAMGSIRYTLFYLLAGLVASVAQVVAMPASTLPGLGASGAIAGVMGAFLLTWPGDEIKTLFFFGWLARITFVPAILLIGLWFVMQIFDQVGSVASVQSGGVAYAAHIGGFLFGLVTARPFEHQRGVHQWRM